MSKRHTAILFLAILFLPALAVATRAQTPAPPPPASTPAPTLTPTPTIPDVAALCVSGLDKCFDPARINYGWQFAFFLLILFFLAVVVVSILYDKTKGALLRLWDRLASRLRFASDPAREYLKKFVQQHEDPKFRSLALLAQYPDAQLPKLEKIYLPVRVTFEPTETERAAAKGVKAKRPEKSGEAALFESSLRERIEPVELTEAIKGSPPLSVTMAESIEQLRDWARTRCVPAD